MDKKLYTFTAQEHAVIRAALGALAAVLDLPSDSQRPMQNMLRNVAPDLVDPARHVDKLLDRGGLEFSEVVQLLGKHETVDPHVAAARQHPWLEEGTLEVDETAMVNDSTDGKYVMAWLFIRDDVAGVDGVN